MLKKTVDLWRISMIITFLHQGFAYRSWENKQASYLDEGDSCEIITGDPGICTFIGECDLYYNGLIEKTIPYSSLVRCSFKGFSEIICCPKTVVESWRQLVVTTDTNFVAVPSFAKVSSLQNWGHLVVTTGESSLVSPFPKRLLKNYPNKLLVTDHIKFEDILPKTVGNEGSLEVAETTRGADKKLGELKKNVRPAAAACMRVYFNQTFPHGFVLAKGSRNFPHMGALIYPDDSGADFDFFCGTSLISERYTLTSASCVSDENAQPTKVRFGVIELFPSPGSDRTLKDIDIEIIILHPDYNDKFIYHDIALIRLKENVQFSEFIRPACLYFDSGDINKDITLSVAGWGIDEFQALLSVNLSTVGLLECNGSHVERGVSRSMQNGILEGQYCTDANEGACEIIGGGPLLFVQEYLSTIVGVVSEELQCGSRVPYVYTRVGYYLSWIEEIVWP